MFGLFTRKEKKSLFQPVRQNELWFNSDGSQSDLIGHPLADIELPIQLNQLTTIQDGFSRFNWKFLFESLTQLSDTQQQQLDTPELFNYFQGFWLNELNAQLGQNYSLNQSDNFILLSAKNDRQLKLIFSFLESAYQRILMTLNGIAKPRQGDKLAVILFDEIESYYRYIAYYYPDDGEYQMSSGCFLNEGAGHFALPDTDMSSLESVVAHELTHALVNHLNIPLWLNEGLAVNTEIAITGYSPYLLNSQKHNKHVNYWNEKTIQEFWFGSSFSKPGDASELSYHLAQLLVHSLSENFEQFSRFVNQAEYQDAGEAAAIRIFGGSLGDLIESIYGEGEWAPYNSKGSIEP